MAQAAAAQGTFSPYRGSSYSPYYAPRVGAGSPSPSPYAAPSPYRSPQPSSSYRAPSPYAPGFQPYRPYSGHSVYGGMRQGSMSGARPCATSVYTNACGD